MAMARGGRMRIVAVVVSIALSWTFSRWWSLKSASTTIIHRAGLALPRRGRMRIVAVLVPIGVPRTVPVPTRIISRVTHFWLHFVKIHLSERSVCSLQSHSKNWKQHVAVFEKNFFALRVPTYSVLKKNTIKQLLEKKVRHMFWNLNLRLRGLQAMQILSFGNIWNQF